MLLTGYLYGIKSERRLVQEIQLNIAYGWFCSHELGEKIPDHSAQGKINGFATLDIQLHQCYDANKAVAG